MSAQKRIYTKYYNKKLIPKDQIGNKYKNKKAKSYKIGMKYHNKKGSSLKIWGGNKYYNKKKIGNRQHDKKIDGHSLNNEYSKLVHVTTTLTLIFCGLYI